MLNLVKSTVLKSVIINAKFSVIKRKFFMSPQVATTWSDQVKSFSLWAWRFIVLALIQEPMEQLFFSNTEKAQ